MPLGDDDDCCTDCDQGGLARAAERRPATCCSLAAFLVSLLLFAMSWDSLEPTEYGLVQNGFTGYVDLRPEAVYESGRYFVWLRHFFLVFPRNRRNLDFDEDNTEARKLVESAAATVSAERQEARVAEATQRALTRLNELESAAAAAERRVRGAEEREATLRRVVDAAKADVRSRARPEPCVGWLATLAMLFLAFGAGMMVQTPYPTYAVTH